MNKTLSNIANVLGGEKVLSAISRSSDIVLAILVISVIMMFIIPVPPHVIDVLIAINLMISIALLFVSLYIQRAVQISIFPSLLLLTTLFRLSINIASTRQILLHAYAGEVIKSFGNFVVGGNYVVGIVVFLIITIVQFIVVTKGAERVAEVAARFTLDAMPGKQMSIDADLRSGTIDTQQARDLRLMLNKESQLYGAMDGAMKFVKGDVIASIVIAAINIVGGLIIGMFMHKMSLGDAAQIFTLLSIGDGLVSQIPSLMIAITAGIVTTRVSSDRKDANLGKDISDQILKQPKALIITSSVLFLIAILPGLPAVPFLLLSSVVGGGSFFLWKATKRKAMKAAAGIPEEAVEAEGHEVIETGGEEYALTLPVLLELGSSISKLVKKDKQNTSFLEGMIPKMRHALYQDLGVRFPGVHVRTDSLTIAPDEYIIHLNEVPINRGKVLIGHLLVSEKEDTLRKFNIPFTSAKSSFGMTALWVSEKYREVLSKAGIKFWTSLEVLILHLSRFYKQHSQDFIGIQEVRSILEFVEKSFPDLTKEVTRLIPLQKLTDIFKRLVQEQVSIKDLRTIMESLSEWAQAEKDPVLLTEYIRSSLKRYISYKYSLGQNTLAVYTLDPEIEDMIRGAIKQTSAGPYLALDPDSVQLIIKAMHQVVAPTIAGAQPPVLLTAIDVRRFARKLIEGEFPDLTVLSYQEIVPEIHIQPLGRIKL